MPMVTKTLLSLSSLACSPPCGLDMAELGLLFIDKEINIWRGEVTYPRSYFEHRPIEMKQLSQGHVVVRPITYGGYFLNLLLAFLQQSV